MTAHFRDVEELPASIQSNEVVPGKYLYRKGSSLRLTPLGGHRGRLSKFAQLYRSGKSKAKSRGLKLLELFPNPKRSVFGPVRTGPAMKSLTVAVVVVLALVAVAIAKDTVTSGYVRDLFCARVGGPFESSSDPLSFAFLRFLGP